MKDQLKIGFIIADVDEYGDVESYLSNLGAEEGVLLGRKSQKLDIKTDDGKTFTVHSVLSGVGKVNAAAATAALICQGADAVISTGFSGCLLESGHPPVIIGTRYSEHDFDLTGLGYKPGEKPAEETYIYPADKILLESAENYFKDSLSGTLASGDRFVCSNAERDRVVADFSAVACDMETGAEASVCYFGKVRFLSIRNVSDNADDSAAGIYREEINTCPKINFFVEVLNWIFTLKDNKKLWS